jgi:hypothetical protein
MTEIRLPENNILFPDKEYDVKQIETFAAQKLKAMFKNETKLEKISRILSK